jgi:hypothetical protein
MISSRRAALAAAVVLSASGCRGCFCANATKAMAKTAPEDVVREEAKKQIEASPAKMSTICGVSVSALKDVVVTVVKSEWARHEVKIEGKAVPIAGAPPPADEDDDDDDDASASATGDGGKDAGKPAARAKDAGAPVLVDPAKALRCAGVFVMTIDPVLDDHGDRTGWKVTSFEVDSVSTPGVHHRSHRRRHHHH